MSPLPASSTDRRHLVVLKAPQHVNDTVDRLKRRASAEGFVPDPFAAMIPLCESAKEIMPPVPGLLPRCGTPLIVADIPHAIVDGAISYLPVDAGNWLGAMIEALTSSTGENWMDGDKNLLYPVFSGIPIAFAPRGVPKGTSTPGIAPGVIPEQKHVVAGWRALVLECMLVEWAADRPWYLSAAWTVEWRRRLHRAPLSTNYYK